MTPAMLLRRCVAATLLACTTRVEAQGVAPASLVRCAANSHVPCLVTRTELTPREARLAARADSALSRNWTGRLAGIRLIGPALRPINSTSRPFKLMILMDLSGSMRGEGVAFVRSAAHAFLAELPPSGVAVAVAPFESRQVVSQIASARYVSPTEAIAVLEALPPPNAAGNTALYEAVRAGIASLDRAVPASDTETRSGLLLLTDGRNDVAGRRDDPGLLTGDEGRRVAREAADKSRHQFWIIGAGNVDAKELRALAGTKGQPYIIALNPILLNQSLTSVAHEISTVRELVFGLSSGSRLRLARARIPGAIRFRETAASANEFTRQLAWRPPLFALPAFEGVADSASLPTEVRAVMDVAGSDASRRWMLLIFFGLNGVLLGGVLPRFVWSPAIAPAAPESVISSGVIAGSNAGTPAKAVAAAAAPDNGLRSDVHEVAPRKPDDITGSFAAVVK